MSGDSAVAVLVLAAGSSKRFGGQKLLAPFGPGPLVRRVVENAVASAADHVIVVLGEDGPEVRRALKGLPVAVIHNSAHREGMASSIRAGIAALPEGTEWALVCLGDQPGVTATLMDRILGARANHGSVVAPVYRGEQGNPVLFRATVFPELLELEGDRGARAVVEREAGRVIPVPVDAPMPGDVDTPEDLRRLAGG